MFMAILSASPAQLPHADDLARGVSGSANWLGNQTRLDLYLSTFLLRVAHASATVADAREANQLSRLCRQQAHVPIRVSPIPLDDLTFVGFGDCG